MRYKDHRDPEYWILRIRTHEWAEHQLVSFLDIPGIGKGTIRALWKVGVTTARMLMEADAEELARRLRPYNIPQCSLEEASEIIRNWQVEIERRWKDKEAAQATSPEYNDRGSP